MSTDRNKNIRRIQKLQALARGEAESGNAIAAESAARIAAKLMVEHAISATEVERPISDDPMVAHESSTGRNLVWLRQLYHAVATANNCSTSYVTKSDTVTFYGTRSDCEVAEFLAVHLAREVQLRADLYMHERREQLRRENTAAGYRKYVLRKGLRNSFAMSAVTSLDERLQAMRREALKEAAQSHGDAAASTALVVLDNKLALAEGFRDSFGMGKGRTHRYRHNTEGSAAGNDININRGLGGTSVRGIPAA